MYLLPKPKQAVLNPSSVDREICSRRPVLTYSVTHTYCTCELYSNYKIFTSEDEVAQLVNGALQFMRECLPFPFYHCYGQFAFLITNEVRRSTWTQFVNKRNKQIILASLLITREQTSIFHQSLPGKNVHHVFPWMTGTLLGGSEHEQELISAYSIDNILSIGFTVGVQAKVIHR